MRGLQASARHNAAAYGYSVTITASFGILAAVRGAPRVAELFVFAAGAVVGFPLIEAIASGGFRHRLRDQPSDVRALGVTFSFPLVGLALLAALAAGGLAGGLLAWPLGSLLATVVYLLVFALEMGIGERLQPEIEEGAKPEGEGRGED